MIHYFGINLATMRTIVIIMAMAALTTAQERKAFARIKTHIRKTDFWGTMHFSQSAPGAKVQVFADLVRMEPGKYSIFVHENGKETGYCSSAGRLHKSVNPITRVPFDGKGKATPIVRFDTKGKSYFRIDDTSAEVISLVPNTTNSIIGRSVVIHDDRKFVLEYMDTYPQPYSGIACGTVYVAHVPITTVAPRTAKTPPSTTNKGTTARTPPSTTKSTTASTTSSGFCGFVKRILSRIS